ncbi:hypothetical protein [Spirosoma endbachense]|uniref:hypothetical protein n=1 Tax=Spirosoma endbachense TaxID=2666025 RepID=UPI001391FC1B|nr:hypothetical protein [Spirosoma endbachense]
MIMASRREIGRAGTAAPAIREIRAQMMVVVTILEVIPIPEVQGLVRGVGKS